MENLFLKNPGACIAALSLVGTGLVFIVWLIAHHWSKVRQLEAEAALKQDMLNRGMSADDIERVIRVSATAPPPGSDGTKPESVSDNEYYLVEKLVDEGKSADEIERIIRACKTPAGAAAPLTDSAHPGGVRVGL